MFGAFYAGYFTLGGSIWGPTDFVPRVMPPRQYGYNPADIAGGAYIKGHVPIGVIEEGNIQQGVYLKGNKANGSFTESGVDQEGVYKV